MHPNDHPSPGDSFPDASVEALWRSLRRHVAKRVRAADQADDVVQDAWLRLLSRPPEKHDRVCAWLRVVAERLVLEHARRRRSRLERERLVARSEAQAIDGPPSGEESAVLRWLAELREPYREVVRLRYLEDLATADIAVRLGRSEATVRSQIKRGLDLLRRQLGVEPRSGAGRTRSVEPTGRRGARSKREPAKDDPPDPRASAGGRKGENAVSSTAIRAEEGGLSASSARADAKRVRRGQGNRTAPVAA